MAARNGYAGGITEHSVVYYHLLHFPSDKAQVVEMMGYDTPTIHTQLLLCFTLSVHCTDDIYIAILLPIHKRTDRQSRFLWDLESEYKR